MFIVLLLLYAYCIILFTSQLLTKMALVCMQEPLDKYLKQLMPEVCNQYYKMESYMKIEWSFIVHFSVNIYRVDVIKEEKTAIAQQQHPVSVMPNAIKVSQSSNPPLNTIQQAIYMLHYVIVLHEKWIEKICQKLESVDSLKDQEVEDLKKLKESLEKYMNVINIIIMAYSMPQYCSLKKPPKFHEFIDLKQRLQETIRKIKPSCIHELLPESITFERDDFLAAVLGLNADLTSKLKKMDSSLRSHEPDEYYILAYCLNTLDRLDKSRDLTMKESFMECGITESRAEMLSTSLESSPFCKEQTRSYWIKRYIEEKFKYDILLNDPMPRYPYNDDICTDEWFKQLVDVYDVDADGEQIIKHPHLKICNATSKNSTKYEELGETNSYWFHGTDHDSAVNIIEEGIRLDLGSSAQDFSDRDGFYVSGDIDNAKLWAQQQEKSALVIFKKPDITDYKCLNLCQDREDDWKAIVKHFRHGCSSVLPDDLAAEFAACDFVFAPVCSNAAATLSGEDWQNWEPIGYETSRCIVCIKSDKMAQRFGGTTDIEGVIFY